MNTAFLNKYYPTADSNGKHYLVLFILWPFLAFITALINYSQKESRRIVYIFLVYYGLTFVLGNIGVDAERYAMELKRTAQLPFSDFFKIVGGLYTDTSVDIIQPLLTFIVSRFTDDYRILYAFITAIFSFFYLKSFNFLFDRYREKPGLNAFIYMAFFIMVVPVTDVGGFRMPLASWIFFYGAINVILYRDAKYLLISLASSFVHWSFLTANVILILYFLAGNRNLLYFMLVLLSFFLPGLLSSVFRTLAITIGGPIQARYEGYSSEGFILGIQESNESASWFLNLGGDLLYYYLLLAIIVVQISSLNMKKNVAEKNLFSFLLLFLAFVNFAKVIPTFGGRFQSIFVLFAVVHIFLYMLKFPGPKIGLLTLIGIFPMALDAAISFRVGSESINAWILSPGLGLPLLAPSLSVADILFR